MEAGCENVGEIQMRKQPSYNMRWAPLETRRSLQPQSCFQRDLPFCCRIGLTTLLPARLQHSAQALSSNLAPHSSGDQPAWLHQLLQEPCHLHQPPTTMPPATSNQFLEPGGTPLHHIPHSISPQTCLLTWGSALTWRVPCGAFSNMAQRIKSKLCICPHPPPHLSASKALAQAPRLSVQMDPR